MVPLLAGLLLLTHASVALSQTAPAPQEDGAVVTSAKVLAGAAIGLALHEAGHLSSNLILDASMGVKRVSYGGLPFFAITHEPVSPTREFAISSAGFWAQHLSSEWLLTGRPRLRQERAPLLKGLLAFNIGVSVMYAGAAVARTGPGERDTLGMAVSADMAEAWVAPVVLTPALLDAIRYFKPESRVARWASRAAKVGGVLLILRSRS